MFNPRPLILKGQIVRKLETSLQNILVVTNSIYIDVDKME